MITETNPHEPESPQSGIFLGDVRSRFLLSGHLKPELFLLLLGVNTLILFLFFASIIYYVDPFDEFLDKPKSPFAVSRDIASLGVDPGWRAKMILDRAYPHDALIIGTSTRRRS
jgi:hypothetical protein